MYFGWRGVRMRLGAVETVMRTAGPMWSSAPTGLYVCAEVQWETVGGCCRASSARPYSGKRGPVRSPTAYCLMPTASKTT